MRTLILAGTKEAQLIANASARIRGLTASVSLARAHRRPQSYSWPVRIGGWGGIEDYRLWLLRERIEAVVDATHPFAQTMSHRAADVSSDLGIDHIRLIRPSWRPTEDDQWAFLNSEADAVDHIPEGATVFVATGRENLTDLEALTGRTLICRARDPLIGEATFANGTFRFDPGPFTVANERALFRRLGVTWLLARNSGGTGSWPKIEAARELGIPVAMVRRPQQPDCPRATSVAEVIAWMRRRTVSSVG